MNNIALTLLVVGLAIFALVLLWPESEFTKVMRRAEDGDTSPAIFHGVSDKGVQKFMRIDSICREDPDLLELRRTLRRSAERVLYERRVLQAKQAQ